MDYTIAKLANQRMVLSMSLFSRKKQKRPNTYDLLINEINKTKVALEAAYSNFENVIDPDLIDSCIYELNAVQNRYRFLLKQAKATDKNFC